MARKQRLDLQLVERGLAASRQQAQQLIRAGKVRSGDRVLDKPGLELALEAELQVEQPQRFVSRGGEKLLAAIEAFPLALEGRVCLDGGISTGGFSDCLLQHGAARVYGVDVGYGQTAWSLRTDPRLVLKERTNLRHLQPEQLYGEADPWPDLAVADVSFIRLALVLPALGRLLRPERREALLLVKPQFEVGKQSLSAHGLVNDHNLRAGAIKQVADEAAKLGMGIRGLERSELPGTHGNVEYVLWISPNEPVNQSKWTDRIESVAKETK